MRLGGDLCLAGDLRLGIYGGLPERIAACAVPRNRDRAAPCLPTPRSNAAAPPDAEIALRRASPPADVSAQWWESAAERLGPAQGRRDHSPGPPGPASSRRRTAPAAPVLGQIR